MTITDLIQAKVLACWLWLDDQWKVAAISPQGIVHIAGWKGVDIPEDTIAKPIEKPFRKPEGYGV